MQQGVLKSSQGYVDIYNDIKLIKTYISDFNREKNIQFVNDAVTLMV